MENKIPTLSEVKEYFKNALKCKDWKKEKFSPDFTKVIYENDAWIQNAFKNNLGVLWRKETGYAKILTYKNTESKFEITKEQILELSEKFGNDNSSLAKHFLTEHLERMFPEVFETVLGFGEWITCTDYPKFLLRITEIDYDEKIVNGYGFGADGKWMQNIESETWNFKELEKAILSDEDTVTESLKNEAVKRGFKNSTYFLDTNNETYFIDGDKFSFYLKKNKLYINGWEIFCDGKWAKVIETKTIQEAEELLKELGHNFKIV